MCVHVYGEVGVGFRTRMPPSTYAQRNNVSLSEPLCRPFHREERGCRETSRRHVNKPCSCVLQAVWLCTGALELSVVYCNFNCCYIYVGLVYCIHVCALCTHTTQTHFLFTHQPVRMYVLFHSLLHCIG